MRRLFMIIGLTLLPFIKLHAQAAPTQQEVQIAKWERIMQICGGAAEMLSVLRINQRDNFAEQVISTVWPPPQNNDPNFNAKSLTYLLGGVGAQYARGARLWQQRVTEGQARRDAEGGADIIKKAAAKRDVANAASTMRDCDKVADLLAQAMDW